MIVSSIFVIVLVKSGATDSTGLDNTVTSWNMRDNSFIGINILIAVLLDTAELLALVLPTVILLAKVLLVVVLLIVTAYPICDCRVIVIVIINSNIVGRSITDSSSVDCSAKAVMLLAGLLICFSVCWHYCYCLAYW